MTLYRDKRLAGEIVLHCKLETKKENKRQKCGISFDCSSLSRGEKSARGNFARCTEAYMYYIYTYSACLSRRDQNEKWFPR